MARRRVSNGSHDMTKLRRVKRTLFYASFAILSTCCFNPTLETDVLSIMLNQP